MKKMLLAASMLLQFGLATSTQAAEKVVAVATFVEHPSVQLLLKGLREGLDKGGITSENGYRIELQSAQGSTVTAVQIAKKFAGDRPEVIVATGTPVAQPMAQTIKDLPIVFAGLADPLGAKVVRDLQHPGGNITGTSDRAPFGQLLATIKQLVPAAKNIGIVYNAGEANSRASVDRFKTEAASLGFASVEASIAKASDVLPAAQSLVGKADVFYAPNDGTLTSNFEALTRVSLESKIPIFASDLGSVPRGALAATGVDYEQIGVRTAAIVVRVLKGEKPGEIAVDLPSSLDLGFNAKIASQLGVSAPASFRETVKTTVK